MEKKIVLTMLPSKDIGIVINEHNGMTIGKDNRNVKADDIYNLLAYERGDIYTVESINESDKDGPVLQFFAELLRDITDRLNRMSESQGDSEDEGEEEEAPEGNVYSLSQIDDEDLPF